MTFRIGQGIDAHQLCKSYRLILGGVEIPCDFGSKGHSDGDVLIHALVDALLGALNLGDIGTHFPSSDDKWKGAESRIFLEYAAKLIQNQNFNIVNIDATIILQKPKLQNYLSKICENIAAILKIKSELISIKATTTDYLGFTGRSEGIAASAVVLLEMRKNK